MYRPCGSCTLCCTIARVPELEKPENVLCTHCKSGCSIYTERPQTCQDFQCAWSQGAFSEDMRPDKVGFMVEILPEKSVVYVTAIDDDDLIYIDPAVFKEYLDNGVSVVASSGFAMLAEGATVESTRAAILSSARKMGLR